jgi:hypothetical protein
VRITVHVTFTDEERLLIGQRLGVAPDRPATPAELQNYARHVIDAALRDLVVADRMLCERLTA